MYAIIKQICKERYFMCEFGKTGQLNIGVAKKIYNELYLPYKEKAILDKRAYSDDGARERPQFQRDYTRILYSSSFRRLQGKMQLLDVKNTKFFRNRLTHSLEVSQIARAIADDIGYDYNDIYVVEACSLAHDIGNPPFGHHGEKILDNLIKRKIDPSGSTLIEGFESNAQTLRVLTVLQAKNCKYPGMNLTYRTLLGVTKYFYPVQEAKDSKYIYKNDFELLDKLIRDNDLPKRSIDVQIMDIADEIAYAAHDLEDTLNKRLFNIDEFLEELAYWCDSPKAKKKFTEEERNEAISCMRLYVEKTREELNNNYTYHYNTLFTKELGSILINKLIKDIDIVNGKIGFKTQGALAEGLKKVTFECLLRSNEVKYYEKMGEIILTGLFDFFFDNFDFLPIEYKINEPNEIQRVRAVVDYISGMMDAYAIDLYEKYFGKNHFDTFGLMGQE